MLFFFLSFFIYLYTFFLVVFIFSNELRHAHKTGNITLTMCTGRQDEYCWFAMDRREPKKVEQEFTDISQTKCLY